MTKETITCLTLIGPQYLKISLSYLKSMKKVKNTSSKKCKRKCQTYLFFILKYNKNDNYYIVDIHKGLIYINKIQDPEAEFISDKFNIRLIYFRRNRVHMDNNYKEIDRDIIHFLGYQYLDKVGKNHKVIIQISNEGNILIGG